jgi:sporulation protein YlmC with PRC-barrel domain
MFTVVCPAHHDLCGTLRIVASDDTPRLPRRIAMTIQSTGYNTTSTTRAGIGTGPVLASSTLNGENVRNAAGEDLGQIKDLMIDTASGTIQYAVLSFGGWLGMGDKLFAVPWNSMRLDTENHCLVLDVSRDRLKDAPGFDKDNWPDFADPTFTSRISSYYH